MGAPMQKVEEEATKGAQDRQASLIKLAEQTVIEADKLAEIIKPESTEGHRWTA